MRFTKVHGLGNDFILVNCFEEKIDMGRAPDLAVKMCSRCFGVGADGLVLLMPSEQGDVRMRIINSDGSEAEMCGNAIRCVAKYMYEHDMIKKEKIRVETLAGIIIPELILENGRIKSVRVDMGQPRFERSEIPMAGAPGRVVGEPLAVGDLNFKVTAVSMGNPHCVIFVPDAESVALREIGPRIEKHNAFPRKTNVEFVQVLNPGEVIMKVWERGAGETMACGTGACATAVACALNGLTGRKVTVRLKGGDLLIEWAEDDHVYMTGPAAEVFTGEYPV
ncbi:diaminopimelate epimerase [Pelotomaculum propionicicum]|uniref:diaminopimelate epimerase n=1 Tax=Pelotomaculum propionicicum TaxID=258475 RepID=UPI003B782FB3